MAAIDFVIIGVFLVGGAAVIVAILIWDGVIVLKDEKTRDAGRILSPEPQPATLHSKT